MVGWQYFYVDPELLIRRNKALNYMTTDLRKGTRLVEDFRIYEYNPDYTFDRLDMIVDYLQRCVRFLPGAFPNLNLNHQRIFMERLESLLP